MDIKPEMSLELGSEEKFRFFVKNLKDYDRVAVISHKDLDGVASPKIITEFVDPELLVFLDYSDLNKELIEKLDKNHINKIIFSDLYMQEDFIKELEKFSEILILDHHPAPNLNSKKTIHIKSEDGYSACYLCYHLFSKLKDISKWDWLVACTCISDYCHIKPGKWLSAVMKKYGDKLVYEGTYVRKSGKFWDLQYKIGLALDYLKPNLKKAYNEIHSDFGDIGNLEKYSKTVQKEVDKILKKFDENKEEIEGGYFFEFKPKFSIGSLITTIISGSNTHETIITFREGDIYYFVSARRQDKKVDCNKLLKNLLKGLEDADGGGHPAAAGGHFLKKDLPIVRERLGLNSKNQNL